MSDKKILKITGTIEAWFELGDIDEETARALADVRFGQALSHVCLPDVGDERLKLRTCQTRNSSKIVERPKPKRYKVEVEKMIRKSKIIFVEAESEAVAEAKAAEMLVNNEIEFGTCDIDRDYVGDMDPSVIGEVGEED